MQLGLDTETKRLYFIARDRVLGRLSHNRRVAGPKDEMGNESRFMNKKPTSSSCVSCVWGSKRVTTCDPIQPPISKPGSLKLPGFSFSFFPTPAAAISSLQGKPKVHYSQQTSTKAHKVAGTYFVSTIIYLIQTRTSSRKYIIVLRSRTSNSITFAGTKQKLIRGLANGNQTPCYNS